MLEVVRHVGATNVLSHFSTKGTGRVVNQDHKQSDKREGMRTNTQVQKQPKLKLGQNICEIQRKGTENHSPISPNVVLPKNSTRILCLDAETNNCTK